MHHPPPQIAAASELFAFAARARLLLFLAAHFAAPSTFAPQSGQNAHPSSTFRLPQFLHPLSMAGISSPFMNDSNALLHSRHTGCVNSDT